MLSVKQGGTKYHLLSLWYDSTGDWTQISRAIGEHSNHLANVRFFCLLLGIENLKKSLIRINSAFSFIYIHRKRDRSTDSRIKQK